MKRLLGGRDRRGDRPVGPPARRRRASSCRPTALALGFTLVVAMVAGELLRRFRLPRLTGYLLFGVLIGPYLGNVISEPMARQLQTVNGIATTLIALIAGLTLNIERIGRRIAGTTRMIATTLVVAMAGLFAVAWLAWAWLPVAPDAAGTAKLAMVALFVDHRRQLLADDDGGGDLGDRRARTAQRSRAGARGRRRPRRPGPVLAGAAICAGRPRRSRGART